jgi:pimeloyl-ACP methyl ester carboxylesterase
VSSGGPAVLLLHGQPGGAADWGPVSVRLAGHAQVIAVDRPGWNGSERARDLSGNARAALAELDDRGVSSAVVAGHSLGAAVAAWLAALYPRRVSALVLAAPAANLASLYPADYWLAAPIAAEVGAAATMGALGLALSVARLRRRIAGRTGIDAAYLDSARGVLLDPRGWRSYVTEQRALIRDLPALEAQLGAITAPTTILTGTEDRIIPSPAAARLARQIPGARLRFCEGAGHLLPQRHPEVVADAIRAALAAPAPSNLAGR